MAFVAINDDDHVSSRQTPARDNTTVDWPTSSAAYVVSAYVVHSMLPDDENGSHHGPYTQLHNRAVAAIQQFHPTLININPIFVYESMNTLGKEVELRSKKQKPPHSVASWVFLGFAATEPRSGVGGQGVNILCFRGTQTVTEAVAVGWRRHNAQSPKFDLTPCIFKGKSYGQVDSDIWSFYADRKGWFTSAMSDMVLKAVTAVAYASPQTQWLTCAHSLGAALLPLAILDCWSANLISRPQMLPTVTFGGLPVGDATFVSSYLKVLPNFIRIVNFCDRVLEYSSSYHAASPSPLVQIGSSHGLACQSGDFWTNHSMKDVYWPMMSNPILSRTIKPMPTNVSLQVA